MIDRYDYRAKIYVSGHGNSARWQEIPFGDARKAIVPQWRVLPEDIPAKLGDRPYRYRIGFGDVANPRNERSFVSTLIPAGAVCGHKVPTIEFETGMEWAYLPWLAVADSFVMDSLARRRLSSPTMSYTLLDGLPFPRLPLSDSRVQYLAPRVLRLVCTGPEMTSYWNGMAGYGWGEPAPDGTMPPGLATPEERERVMAEIDAFVGRVLFGLAKDELAAVLDSFPVLERREMRANGEYRTKRLVLEQYAALGD